MPRAQRAGEGSRSAPSAGRDSLSLSLDGPMHADPAHYLPARRGPTQHHFLQARQRFLPPTHCAYRAGLPSAPPHLTHTCRPVCAPGPRSGRQEAPSIATIQEASCDTPARQHRKDSPKATFRILVPSITIQCPKAAVPTSQPANLRLPNAKGSRQAQSRVSYRNHTFEEQKSGLAPAVAISRRLESSVPFLKTLPIPLTPW